jgi:large subunit ribosomal protein L32
MEGKDWNFQIFSSIVRPTMAVPKKRTTRARRDLRRFSSAYKLKALNSITCKGCNAPTLPHRVCAECGHYDGRQVMAAASAGAEA